MASRISPTMLVMLRRTLHEVERELELSENNPALRELLRSLVQTIGKKEVKCVLPPMKEESITRETQSRYQPF